MTSFSSANDFYLAYDYWFKDDFDGAELTSDLYITHLPAIPLSLLNKIFGVSAGEPWFNDGILVNEFIASHLPSPIDHEFNFKKYNYRIRLYGDGFTRVTRQNMAFGLTAYKDLYGMPHQLLLFNAKQIEILELLLQSERLEEQVPPYKPISILVDDAWANFFLTPLGVDKTIFTTYRWVYFDVWFGVKKNMV